MKDLQNFDVDELSLLDDDDVVTVMKLASYPDRLVEHD